MTGLEFHVVADRAKESDGVQIWPPHFKLFAYRIRDGCDDFHEILDTANERYIRDANHSCADTLAFAFTLPGHGAACEDVGVSHEMLHKHCDDIRLSNGLLHLAVAVV